MHVIVQWCVGCVKGEAGGGTAREKEGAEGRYYSQVVSQDTPLRGPQMLHQLRIRMFIAHHGGAHLLQGKSQELLSWLLGRRGQVKGNSAEGVEEEHKLRGEQGGSSLAS